MRISDWSSDVCSSDLVSDFAPEVVDHLARGLRDDAQVIGVKESHLPFKKSGRERDRETHQFKEDLDRKFDGEIDHKLAFAARPHRFAIFAAAFGNLHFSLYHILRRQRYEGAQCRVREWN